MKSRLTAFETLKKECSDAYVLVGDTLLVEEVAQPEAKTASGILLASGGAKRIDGLEMNLPVFVRVLCKGEGYYNEETGDAVGLDVEVGDIILVGRMSVNWLSTFGTIISTSGSQLGITRENEIKMRFKGQAAYDTCFNLLNSELAPKG